MNLPLALSLLSLGVTVGCTDASTRPDRPGKHGNNRGDDTGGQDSRNDDTGSTDADGDGLTWDEEQALGTDPDVADSDGDGANDSDEVAGNTDPTDAHDAPYQAGWPIDACRDTVAGTGTREGDVSDDFSLDDQFGEKVHLSDFCDQVVYLVFQAFW